MVEPNSGNLAESEQWSEGGGRIRPRITREVVAVRFAEGEPRQIERAAALREVPFSSYVRAAATRSAFDDLAGHERLAVERQRRAEERERPVVDEVEEPDIYFVDDEPVHSSWGKA